MNFTCLRIDIAYSVQGIINMAMVIDVFVTGIPRLYFAAYVIVD